MCAPTFHHFHSPHSAVRSSIDTSNHIGVRVDCSRSVQYCTVDRCTHYHVGALNAKEKDAQEIVALLLYPSKPPKMLIVASRQMDALRCEREGGGNKTRGPWEEGARFWRVDAYGRGRVRSSSRRWVYEEWQSARRTSSSRPPPSDMAEGVWGDCLSVCSAQGGAVVAG